MKRFKNMLKHFNKTEVQEDEKSVIQRTKSEESQNQELLRYAQDDERFSLAPMREREELLCDRSELSNSGEGYISCAEHTEKVFSPFTSHFSQLCTPHPSPLPQGAREQLSCAKHTEKDLFTYLPIHLFTFKKVAFTLAEVLITLGIIGIVAAMTLPTLVQNYKKTVYVNQLKKSYSTLEQGFQKMLADEGVEKLSDLSYWGAYSNAWNNSKDTTVLAIDNVFNKGFKTIYYTIPDYVVTFLNQPSNIFEDGYTNHVQFADNSTLVGFHFYSTPIQKTPDECRLIKSHGGSMCSMIGSNIWIDVNGGAKGPNKLGRDIFDFNLSDEGKLYPYGGKDICLFWSPNGSCQPDFTGECGQSCAARIIANGWKMDY